MLFQIDLHVSQVLIRFCDMFSTTSLVRKLAIISLSAYLLCVLVWMLIPEANAVNELKHNVINPFLPAMPVKMFSNAGFNKGVSHISVLPLPSYAPYRFLGVASLPRKKMMQYSHEVSETGTIMCFMQVYQVSPSEQELRCVGKPVLLKFDIPLKETMERLDRESFDNYTSGLFSYNSVVGADSPKLVWSDYGYPLLMYSMNSKVKQRQRTQWLSDVRNVFPALGLLWNPTECEEPIQVFDQYELGEYIDGDSREMHALELNWAHMITKEGMLFQKGIAPRRMVRVGDELVTNLDHNRLLRCLKNNYGAPHIKLNHALHQGSNMLRFRNCRHASCDIAKSATYYFQIIHIKDYTNNKYERYGVVWNSEDQKYSLNSMVGPLLFPGLDQAKKQFVISMNFISSTEIEGTCGTKMDYGYLDSQIVLSLDTADGNYIQITSPEILLSNRQAC